MKKIITLSLLSAAALCGTLTSCDIERLPNGSMSAEQITGDPMTSLDGLMRGAYAQLKTWSDPMHRLGEYAGDNIMIRNTSTDAFYEFISFSRTPNNYRLNDFWNFGYKAIAQASNIINMIEAGQSAEIDNKLGECYYIRGMMYFYLTRAFGRPYYQAPDKNLGVPIVNGTPDDMDNLQLPDRSTVKECYQQAIADLRKAEEMLTENNGPAYASKAAAQAMLSRVYLYMSGTYDNPNTVYADSVIHFATEVINNPDYALLSPADYGKSNTIVPENNKEDIFVVKRVASEFSGFDHYYGIGGMYGVVGGMGWGEIYASAKYLSLLDETGRNDWRPGKKKISDIRANFINPQYATDEKTGKYIDVFRFIKKQYDKNGNHTGYNYMQFGLKKKSDGLYAGEPTGKDENKDEVPDSVFYKLTVLDEAEEKYRITDYKNKYGIDGENAFEEDYEGVLDYQMQLNNFYPRFYITKCSFEGEESHLHSPIISRLDEVYLNRAEAYAKKNDYGNALSDLNLIRSRAVGEGYPSLDASNAQELIDKERQLELAFQAERSFDVFRNGEPLSRRYPGAHPALEDVPATDFRVIFYIPQGAIDAYPSGCKLTQNPTDNSGVILH